MSTTDETDAIPRREVLEGMDYNALRTMAAERGLDGSATKDDLVHDLARLRRGGRVMECPRPDCGDVWVYLGSASYKTTCPTCTTSVTIEKNTRHVEDEQ